MSDPRTTQSPQFILSLNSLPNDGSFNCPNCKTLISPDDEGDEAYTLVDTTIDRQNNLETVTVQCRCRAVIRLVVDAAAVAKKGKR
jgi:hypothetical protein